MCSFYSYSLLWEYCIILFICNTVYVNALPEISLSHKHVVINIKYIYLIIKSVANKLTKDETTQCGDWIVKEAKDFIPNHHYFYEIILDNYLYNETDIYLKIKQIYFDKSITMSLYSGDNPNISLPITTCNILSGCSVIWHYHPVSKKNDILYLDYIQNMHHHINYKPTEPSKHPSKNEKN
eukprot:320746_1